MKAISNNHAINSESAFRNRSNQIFVVTDLRSWAVEVNSTARSSSYILLIHISQRRWCGSAALKNKSYFLSIFYNSSLSFSFSFIFNQIHRTGRRSLKKKTQFEALFWKNGVKNLSFVILKHFQKSEKWTFFWNWLRLMIEIEKVSDTTETVHEDAGLAKKKLWPWKWTSFNSNA